MDVLGSLTLCFLTIWFWNGSGEISAIIFVQMTDMGIWTDHRWDHWRAQQLHVIPCYSGAVVPRCLRKLGMIYKSWATLEEWSRCLSSDEPSDSLRVSTENFTHHLRYTVKHIICNPAVINTLCGSVRTGEGSGYQLCRQRATWLRSSSFF